jgi:hypothetical protein
MRYSDLLNNLISKILYSPSRKNFITTNYNCEYAIKQKILNKFPEFMQLADEEMNLDKDVLHKIDNEYSITLSYKIQNADVIEKIIDVCVSKNYDYGMLVMCVALLEDIMINGSGDMFGHHILTMEYVVRTYIDNFIDEYTEHIVLAEDEEENEAIKFSCIVNILNDTDLFNLLLSQASSNILINWLSDFNDLLLYHYRNTPLEEIKEDISGMVSYVAADIKVFRNT